MAKKRLTANQKEYNKQLARIKRNVRKVAREGYDIQISDILPERPKRITKQYLRELKRGYKPRQIRKIAQEQHAGIAEYDDTVLKNVFDDITIYTHESLDELRKMFQEGAIDIAFTRRGKQVVRNPAAVIAANASLNKIKDVLDELESKIGRGGLVDLLNRNKEAVSQYKNAVEYASSEEEIRHFEDNLLTVLREGEVTQEELKDVGDYEELDEIDYSTML